MDIRYFCVSARPHLPLLQLPSMYGIHIPRLFSCPLSRCFLYCNWHGEHGRTDGGPDHESNQPLNGWVARTSQTASRSCFPFPFPFPCQTLIPSFLPSRLFDNSPHRQPFSSAPHPRFRSCVSILCVVPAPTPRINRTSSRAHHGWRRSARKRRGAPGAL